MRTYQTDLPWRVIWRCKCGGRGLGIGPAAQLSAAIRLYFADAHPVAVHTLACAAREILTNLGHHLEMDTYLDDVARWQEMDVATLRKKAVRFFNFMKHADNDPTAVLEDFSDDDNEGVLFCASRDLGQIAQGLPIEAQVFDAWFFATTVKRVSAGGLRWQQKVKACIQLFPGVRFCASRLIKTNRVARSQ